MSRPVTIGLAAAGLIALLTLGYCQITKPSRDAARQSQATATLADGRTAAGGDASAIRDASDTRRDQIALTTKETTDAIRNAPDDAAAGDAGLRGLCELYPGRDARCRMLDAHPRRVD